MTVFLGTISSSSNKSRLLACVMGNMELPCMDCRGTGPNLSAKGLVSWFFSSCSENLGHILEFGGDGYSKLVLVQ